MVVMKFGGSSVADEAAIRRVVTLVERERRPKVVVISALTGVTDRLTVLADLAATGAGGRALAEVNRLRARHVELARLVARGRRDLLIALRREFGQACALVKAAAIVRKSAPRSIDAVLACGELASSRIIAAALAAAGLPAVWIDARRIIVTDARHTRAVPLATRIVAAADRLVRPHLDRGRLVVLGGFIGATEQGATTTLGRGGSDYSAALVGSAMGAEEIQIWTDVDGMLTGDPRLVPAPRLLSRVSFEDAAALARFGAKVLHPSTLAPAVAKNIPVRILNARRAGVEGGTLIAGSPVRRQPIAGFASKGDLTVVTIQPLDGISPETLLKRAFGALERAGVVAELVALSDAGLSIAMQNRGGVAALQDDLSAVTAMAIRCRMALVCAVGESLRGGAAACSRLLAALEDIPVAMISHAGDGRTLACVIPERALKTALGRLHDRYFGQTEETAAIGPPPAGAGLPCR
ncbi:MAG: aspartate kinase [Acidobacteria bacterium]|nr:aspartate kinase [Acidobacteriota bacterium]